jgi:hypothetical protein
MKVTTTSEASASAWRFRLNSALPMTASALLTLNYTIAAAVGR